MQKNTHIYHMGDVIDSVGIVLSGNVIIENIDIWGNKSIISYANEGEIFLRKPMPFRKLR